MPSLSNRQALLHLIILGWILGSLIYALDRLLGVRFPFQLMTPFFLATTTAAMSWGAYVFFKNHTLQHGTSPTRRWLWLPIAGFVVFCACAIFNQHTTLTYLYTFSREAPSIPFQRPKYVEWHILTEVLFFLTLPALFITIGVLFARAYEYAQQPAKAYGWHLLSLAGGGALAHLAMSHSSPIVLCLLCGVGVIGLIPIQHQTSLVFKLAGSLMLMSLYASSSFAPDNMFLFGIRDYQKLESRWSAYYKLDFLEYEPGCMATVYSNMMQYFTCNTPLKDSLQRRQILKAVAHDLNRMLIVGASGGNAAQTLFHVNPNITQIDAVEVDSAVVAYAEDKYASYNNHIYEHPNIHNIAAEGRAFLEKTPTAYDFVFLDGVDGSFALQRHSLVTLVSNLSTKEAYQTLFEKTLTPEGVLLIETGGTSPRPLYPYLLGFPDGIHYRVFWHVVSDMPFVGLPLLWIVASQNEDVLQHVVSELQRVPTIEFVEVPPIPEGLTAPTDNRPALPEMDGFPIYSLSTLIGILGFFLAWLLRQRATSAVASFVPPRTSLLFFLLGVGFVQLEVLLIVKNVRWSTAPALWTTLLLGAFLLGSALSNIRKENASLSSLKAMLLRSVVGIAFLLYLTWSLQSLWGSLLVSLGAGWMSGSFWAASIKQVPEKARSFVLAVDGIGSLVGALLFQMVFVFHGMHVIASMIVLTYLLATLLWISLSRKA